MTTVQAEKIAPRKLSLQQLARQLGNVPNACRIVGYELRRDFQLYGGRRLARQPPGAKGPHPSRVPDRVEEAILAHALEHPTHGAQRVAGEILRRGIEGEFRRCTGRSGCATTFGPGTIGC